MAELPITLTDIEEAVEEVARPRLSWWDVVRFPFVDAPVWAWGKFFDAPDVIEEALNQANITDAALWASLFGDPEPERYPSTVARRPATGEIYVPGQGWVDPTTQAAQNILARAGQPLPEYQSVLGERYGTVTALDQPPGVIHPAQLFVPVVGTALTIRAVILADAVIAAEEAAAHLAEQTADSARSRLAGLRTEAENMEVNLPYGSVGTEPVDPGLTPFVIPQTTTSTTQSTIDRVRAAATDPMSAITGAGTLAGLMALMGIGGAAAGRYLGGNGASTAAGHPHAAHHQAAIRKQALMAALINGGYIPTERRKYPRKWFNPKTGHSLTLPKKRRARGISAGDVRTVGRVHRKFKSVAKSLGYAFSSGGRGTVKATSGRFKKKR